MKIVALKQLFFRERSSPFIVQLVIFFATAAIFGVIFLLHRNGWLPLEAVHLLLYLFFALIYTNTLFNGFLSGILFASMSSLLAVYVLLAESSSSSLLSTAKLQVFPFVTLYYLTAIITDWFRQTINKLRMQIQENERLCQQARQMEKLALAGEIAAGIAHEIRNPLTVIQGYIQLLQKSTADTSRDSETYLVILEEIQRTNAIISDFLRFSRPDQPHVSMVQINELVENAAALLYGETLRKNVRFHLYPDPALPPLLLDKDQIIQVFLNLFTNALQAMPLGGSLSVLTQLDKKRNQVLIHISDTGHGITPANLGKIFAPFFTTRDEGTGMGLSITHNIVNAHAGQICVESTPGQGSRFTISLPLTADGMTGNEKKGL
ncbi:MAG: Sporulation kinase E [Syntrophomonadaceae bacterium]|nr:Sporulation kinase E [Bacillota bacterium]